MRFTLACLAALASSAAAYMINSPMGGDRVYLQGGTTITWAAVESDAPLFDLWLVNMRHFPPYARRIQQGINRNALSYSVQGVSDVPPNTGYQFNFVRHNADENEAKERPLAQSADFDVTATGLI
ncbi:hypothetical protein BDV38DRAFT_286457 [Aspergillus pseudotamarii]|uniref:Yeast cell wall synthesis Kre9/Knh1-like N-terminal domain-containing protein n=1 Tax=Aspergillus pseudotamarii TaxID=132259 RepID=A0A5N6SGJ0_ASPPS|nr:uncharacterized protein BDV38DRAFT_286457 [Aspergillus pseudotamarii]KAE8133836.1 hypothetical protein BDV38DRAFT_286457 [Aspergillus pseudotamarii]